MKSVCQKKKIAISIDQDLYDWLRREVDSEEHKFSSVSYAIEFCIAYLKKDKEFELAEKRTGSRNRR